MAAWMSVGSVGAAVGGLSEQAAVEAIAVAAAAIVLKRTSCSCGFHGNPTSVALSAAL
jgi:hypothetical protein